MADLENTFGSEFAEQYKQEIAKRREERQKVTDEVRAEVAHLAVNEGKFKDGDPNFSITTEADVTHDVLLMQLPQLEGKSVFGYASELDSGAVTCPLDYMGEWMSCLFNDPDDLKRMEEGEHYVIIGNLDQWENDQGQLQDQVSPVRGVLSLEEAKELGDAYLDGDIPDSDGEDKEEESDDSDGIFGDDDSSDDEEEEEEGGNGGGGLDGFLSEEDEEEEDGPDVDYDDVSGVVEVLADKDEVVWDLEEGDDRVEKVVNITVKQLELDEDDEAVEDAVRDHVLNRISEGPEAEAEEEEEEDEEDKMF